MIFKRTFCILNSYPLQNSKKINLKEYFAKHPVNPTRQWQDLDEAIVIPHSVPFKNDSYCGSVPQTYFFGVYHGYGKFAPVKRNPT